MEGFLRTLGEREVPLEQLPAKLAEIAEEHRELLTRLAALAGEEAPQTRALIEHARAAIAAGEHDQADRLLGEAEEAELAAAQQAETAAERRRSRAAPLGERGALALTRLDYLGAAEHFATAGGMVGEPEQRAGYLDRQAKALYRQGDERGDNAALNGAIAVYRGLLEERPRERVPLDWATTQNNLGNALQTLGERESGTARLEEAVAAYRAAAGFRDATLFNNDGPAVAPLATRRAGS